MMLRRQYIRYAEESFSVELLEESPGEVVGIKSCTLKLKETTHMVILGRKVEFIDW